MRQGLAFLQGSRVYADLNQGNHSNKRSAVYVLRQTDAKMNNKLIMITKAAQEDGYWINGHFVFKANWEISKYRFNEEEIGAFETAFPKLKKHKNNSITKKLTVNERKSH